MNVGFRFNTVACLTVFVGLLTFCLADGRPGLALVCAVVCLIGWMSGRGQGGWAPATLPRALVNLLVLGAILNAAVHAGRTSAGLEIVSHLGEFLVYVLLLKLFDRRTGRDESQLLTLSLFVVIAAMLTSNTLAVGVCLIVYTPLAIWAALLFQLRSGLRRGLGEGSTAVAAPRVFAGEQGITHLRRVALLSLLCASVLAGAVFVLTPRGLGNGALGRFGETRIAQTGFTEQIRLGQAGFLRDSPAPVLELSVEDSSGANLGSGERVYYLRGLTRNRYQGDIWTTSPPTSIEERAREGEGEPRRSDPDTPLRLEPDGAIRAEPGGGGGRGGGGGGVQITQRITLRTNASSDQVLFSLWRPVVLTTAEASNVAVNPFDLSVRLKGSLQSGFSYVVQSSPTDGQWNGHEPRRPGNQFRGPIRDLAQSILTSAHVAFDPELRDRASNRQAASAFRDYLQRNFTYSREMDKPARGVDPLRMFLFDTRRGHCEYFASAMVALCQSVGLPARLVVGYVAADYNSMTGTYLVRQSNAHAWAEFHVGDGSWQTIDPSPPEDVAALRSNGHGWLSVIRNWYDGLEFGWNRSIVGFDATAQQHSTVGKRLNFDGLSRWFDDATGRLFVAAKEFRRPGGTAESLGVWVFPMVAALGVGVVLIRAWNRGSRGAARRRTRSRAYKAPGTEGSGFYARALRLLARGGLSKPDSLPPLAHSRNLERSRHPAAEPLAVLSGLHYLGRFSGRRLSKDQLAAAERSLSSLRAAAGRAGKSV